MANKKTIEVNLEELLKITGWSLDDTLDLLNVDEEDRKKIEEYFENK